jgi:excisionase family DNA binding protein
MHAGALPVARPTAFWQPAELARHLRLSTRTVRRWCADGTLRGAVQLPGGGWRIPESAIDALLRQAAPTG